MLLLCLLFVGTCIFDIFTSNGFLSKVSVSHTLFFFRVLGKQLLSPKDEGFQHFESRSDSSVDIKCLPGLRECTSNIKEYVHVFKFSFLFFQRSKILLLLKNFSVIKYMLLSLSI